MQHWNQLEKSSQLRKLAKASFERPQLIFKHSIRCGISAQSWHRILGETEGLNAVADLHYLDLINYRTISNAVAADFGVPHQSPQAILLRDGKPVYQASHFSINADAILAAAEKVIQ
ncbi:MAG: bacillithiol system redox-active protein YtxJ [Bacteroidota bacterium]